LLDLALVQHNDAISQVHDFVVVMHDENCGQGPALVTLAQPAGQLLAPVRVERAEGFVEQENARHDGESGRQREALALAYRKLHRRQPPI